MPSENDKKPVTGCEKKQKKRPCSIEVQGFIKERFLIENQKAQEEYQDNFFEKFLDKKTKMEAKE